MSVATVGEGARPGIAVAFLRAAASRGEYVLVASAEGTSCPGVTVAAMEVLKVYVGVVKEVGVERRKFGSVVACVAELAARKDAISAVVSFRVVALDMG